MRIAIVGLLAVACGRPPEADPLAEGPAATPDIVAITEWAAAIDADTARVRPKRCIVPKAAAEEAALFVQRPNDSSMKLVVEYGNRYNRAARAIDNFFAIRDSVRLFVRVDEHPGFPETGLRARHNEDTLWFARGRLARWVDSAGRSHPTDRRSAGYRYENNADWFREWLRAARPCL